MNNLIVLGAKYLIVLIVFIAGIYFLKINKEQKKKMITLAIISLPIIFIISRIAGKFYFNPRPFVVGNYLPLVAHTNDNGFPSDHTLLSAAIAMIVYYFDKKIGIFLLTLALLVGLFRVMAGVHHLTDIFGSILIAIMTTYLVNLYLPKNI